MKNHQLFQAKIENGQIVFSDITGIQIWKELLEGKEIEIDISRKEQRRSGQQNKALHKFFEQVSEEFNEQGIGISVILAALKPGVDIFPTPEFVKELWRLFQKAQLKKISTTQLNKAEDIDRVYELFVKFLGSNFGIYISFPSSEDTHPAFQ